MFSIMIVDDEKAIRNNLPQIVDFQGLGFVVSATAKNGQEALEQYLKNPVDLILLDISMPVLDGIGLLEKLSQQAGDKMPDVIIMSGYSNFEYARAAIRYGVKDYLMKPIDEDELTGLLTRLHGEMEARSESRTGLNIRREAAMVRKMYHGDNQNEAERGSFRQHMVLHCVLLTGDGQQENTSVRELIEPLILGGAEAFLRQRGSVFSYLVRKSVLDEYQHSATLFARHIVYCLRQQGKNCAVLLDDGLFEKEEGSFRNDFSLHLYRMLTGIFWGNGSVVTGEESLQMLAPLSEQRLDNEEKRLMQLGQAIRDGQEKDLSQLFEEMVSALFKRKTNVFLLHEICYRIYYLLLDLLSENGKEDNRLSPLDFRELPVFYRFEEWKQKLWEQILDTAELVWDNSHGRKNGAAEQAVAYLRQHFREPVTLKSVADTCFVSAAYLGRCFQKTFGVSFKQYLNDLRLEEAKRLLRQTDHKIYEIAAETGFVESKYLVAKFTAAENCSPTEYRKRANQGSFSVDLDNKNE